MRLEVLKGLMRHSDIKQTLIYAPYDMSEGRQAIALLEAGMPSGQQAGKSKKWSRKNPGYFHGDA
ncbi:MAG: hypothetical protein WCS52_07970 [bacterium]